MLHPSFQKQIISNDGLVVTQACFIPAAANKMLTNERKIKRQKKSIVVSPKDQSTEERGKENMPRRVSQIKVPNPKRVSTFKRKAVNCLTAA